MTRSTEAVLAKCKSSADDTLKVTFGIFVGAFEICCSLTSTPITLGMKMCNCHHNQHNIATNNLGKEKVYLLHNQHTIDTNKILKLKAGCKQLSGRLHLVQLLMLSIHTKQCHLLAHMIKCHLLAHLI